MADSVDDLDLELGRVHGRPQRGSGDGGALTPGQQIRQDLRGKHVCPFCGTTRQNETGPCTQCSLEDSPTTRAATRSKLGPWYVLQSRNPSAPGMSFATMLLLIQKGRVTARSVIRGPTTTQYWRHAAKVKGISREFGLCWNCGQDVARNARACSNCKRLQEPPLNPDVLLETGPDAGLEPIPEKVWAEGQSAAASPVDRLAMRGGVRREVPPVVNVRRGTLLQDPDMADVGEGTLPSHARRRDLTDESPELASVAESRTREARLRDPRHREPLERAAPVSFGVGYDDEYGHFGRSHRRRGGMIAKLFKVLLVALFLGAIGTGAIAYLDPDGAGRRLREHAKRAWQWTSAKMNSAKSAKPAPNGVGGPATPLPTTGSAANEAAGSKDAAPVEDFSKLTPEQAKYKVYQLWESGEAAANRGDHKKAVALWESIKRLPGVKEEDWPLGLNARIELARKNVK